MEQTDDKGNRKKIIGIIAGIVAFGLAYFGAQQLFKAPSFDKAMMEAASELNKTCPIMVDAPEHPTKCFFNGAVTCSPKFISSLNVLCRGQDAASEAHH